MKKRKSKFWLFLFSFVPGAGEMYMGLMKMGLSLLLGFLLSIMVISFTNIGELAMIAVTIYIYSFFHAHNIGDMEEADFQALEDTYLFGFDSLEQLKLKPCGRYRSVAAAALILIGIVTLVNVCFDLLGDLFGWDNEYLCNLFYFVRNEVPRILFGIAIIWGGIVLLRGKKTQESLEIKEEESGSPKENVSGMED